MSPREGFPPITELMPHVEPIVAVDELLEWEPDRARARAAIRAEHAFARRGHVETAACLELMAQTVATCLGHRIFQRGESVRNGMVISCRKLVTDRARIEIGEPLEIEVRCLRTSDVASQFEGEVHDASGARVAAASFTLVHGEAPTDG